MSLIRRVENGLREEKDGKSCENADTEKKDDMLLSQGGVDVDEDSMSAIQHYLSENLVLFSSVKGVSQLTDSRPRMTSKKSSQRCNVDEKKCNIDDDGESMKRLLVVAHADFFFYLTCKRVEESQELFGKWLENAELLEHKLQ